MKKYKFGVLGAGNMGTAIAEGAVRAGRFAPEQVLMFNRSEEKRAAHAAEGYAVTGDYTEVYAESEIVLLADKPQALGLAVPGMPIGSPGMDGPEYGGRRDPYSVLLVRKDGSTQVFSRHG